MEYFAVKRNETGTHNSLDESPRNDAKWKKSNSKMLHIVLLHSYKILEMAKLQK